MLLLDLALPFSKNECLVYGYALLETQGVGWEYGSPPWHWIRQPEKNYKLTI